MDKKIKNLLFDLGGVIMDIKRDNCVAALTQLGVPEHEADDLLGLYAQNGPFLALEEGKITPSEFRDVIRTKINHSVSDMEMDEAFNAFLIGIPKKRLEALRELRKKYKIYMLSNTNAIMYDSKIKESFEIEGFTREDYFDGISLSFEAKSSKPDALIFDYTINKLGILPEETLFFDDSQKNLDAAKHFGFATYLVCPGTEFMEYFQA